MGSSMSKSKSKTKPTAAQKAAWKAAGQRIQGQTAPGTPAQREEARRAKSLGMLIGIGLIIVGVVVTVATYSNASEGGTYVVAFGPIIAGIVTLVKSAGS